MKYAKRGGVKYVQQAKQTKCDIYILLFAVVQNIKHIIITENSCIYNQAHGSQIYHRSTLYTFIVV